MGEPRYYIFTAIGDARGEIDEVLRELGADAASAGLHKLLHVTRANQTVVFVVDRDAPLARALRGRRGWTEPPQP